MKQTNKTDCHGNFSQDCFAIARNDKGESGRSMVEMLGVLAIIGVLSVTGIAGYSMAMRKHKANEIISTASSFYMLAEAGTLSGGLAGADYGVGGVNLAQAGISKPFKTVDMSYNPSTQTMNITGVGNEDVCERVREVFTVERQGFTIGDCS